MGQRLDLQSLLENVLGSREVYFQPPATVQMTYPCIVYKRDYVTSIFADNNVYRQAKRYSVTAIDRNPDSDIPDKLAALPLSKFTRYFSADNLHHDVYDIYF